MSLQEIASRLQAAGINGLQAAQAAASSNGLSASGGRQSRFFGATRKGENFELRADLNSEYRDKRKDAIKRVIANMTVGKDVSGLFPDVLKNMQTEDLEQKKLV